MMLTIQKEWQWWSARLLDDRDGERSSGGPRGCKKSTLVAITPALERASVSFGMITPEISIREKIAQDKGEHFGMMAAVEEFMKAESIK